MYLGGLDVGTSGCKITIYNEKGEFVEKQYQEYNSNHQEGLHEIDAKNILKAVETVISDLKNKPDIMSVTSFGETFVVLDENDNILCNSMLYTDPRGEEEVSLFDKETVMKISYYKPHGMYSLPKIAWIKNNRPEIYEKAKRILLIEDFVVYMLTGKAYISYSLATRTMGFDIKNKTWSKTIFDMAGIDIEKMSIPAETGTVVGVSNKFGLKDTKVIVGCHDQVASAIGAGVFESGEAVDGSGSVECITPVFSELPEDIAVCDKGYSFVPYVNGKYVCYAFSYTGGTALKWYKDNFASDMSYAELDEKSKDIKTNVLTLPHFAGAATPYMDAHAKAQFANVSLEASKYDFYRSIMEGVAFEMKINTDTINDFGIRPQMLYATGGGSKSKMWLQIKADILNLPICPIDAPEVGTLGIIMLCSVAAGLYENLEEARKVFSKKGETIMPREAEHERYLKMYEKYKKLYENAKILR